jgi:hypothetical protein
LLMDVSDTFLLAITTTSAKAAVLARHIRTNNMVPNPQQFFIIPPFNRHIKSIKKNALTKLISMGLSRDSYT